MLRTLGLKPLRFGSKPVAETLEISLSCVTSVNNISALQQLFGRNQAIVSWEEQNIKYVNKPYQWEELDIVICTTGNYHLVDQLPLPSSWYYHHNTENHPMSLGFECQALLGDNLGNYDYYCFLEDDLIIRDPLFFLKLDWFTNEYGNQCLLQPNRYELAIKEGVNKFYIDGNIVYEATKPFQNIEEEPLLKSNFLGRDIDFYRPLNPHAGCYFLNAKQMEYWTKQPHFLDLDTSFVGPLESAATLGIMKTFNIYKPSPENANFLEIEHGGAIYIPMSNNLKFA